CLCKNLIYYQTILITFHILCSDHNSLLINLRKTPCTRTYWLFSLVIRQLRIDVLARHILQGLPNWHWIDSFLFLLVQCGVEMIVVGSQRTNCWSVSSHCSTESEVKVYIWPFFLEQSIMKTSESHIVKTSR
ncbi:hypothetical protein T310_9915, partial [Rasamsonia emersonii CBS 393.64]